jgi:transcriptional regulator with XRE-family HTH domain
VVKLVVEIALDWWIILIMQDRRIAFRVRRAALDLTQRDAANAAGIEFNRYVRIETGVFQPTPDERKAISKALKVKPAELVKAFDLFPEQGVSA